jgi:hypothetical protein
MAEMHALLTTAGFANINHCLAIIKKGSETMADFISIKEKDLYAMAKEFSEWCIAATRIHIPIWHMTRLCGLMYWIQDAYRCNEEPELAEFDEAALANAIERVQI